jgi:orotidine-5'-phosphate decarboxylase
MNKQELISEIRTKKSFLCVGLDTDITKIPSEYLESDDPVFEFNKAVIEATSEYCVSYKPNLAFYEALGPKGLESLKKTLAIIPKNIFTIADAKRGDIGNTSTMYAKSFFEYYGFDSVTLSPYMGSDSITPYMEFEGKWSIILAATSNKGAEDLQMTNTENKQQFFEEVLDKANEWGNAENTMFVVGATRPEIFQKVRKKAPHHFLLVPGVGAQGGSLEEVCKYGLNSDIGMLVNSSRGIIYPKQKEGQTHKEAVAEAAKKLAQEMAVFVK